MAGGCIVWGSTEGTPPMATKLTAAKLDRLAAAAAAAIEAAKAAKAAEEAARAALLAALQGGGIESAETLAGKVSVCKGRRTVAVTCPALKARLKALTEAGLLSGAAEERIGAPYVTIRG
jgi:hypothetical protein